MWPVYLFHLRLRVKDTQMSPCLTPCLGARHRLFLHNYMLYIHSKAHILKETETFLSSHRSLHAYPCSNSFYKYLLSTLCVSVVGNSYALKSVHATWCMKARPDPPAQRPSPMYQSLSSGRLLRELLVGLWFLIWCEAFYPTCLSGPRLWFKINI
jgi:hypothetical protein